MTKVYEQSLLELLPFSLQQDPVLITMAEAAEIQLKEAYREAENIFNLVDIDNVPEHLLDLLAYEKHVDFYDAKWPVRIKRAVVKSSISQHRKKGTRGAVEAAVKRVFGDGVTDEWFDYGGDPYYFRVVTEQSLATDVDLKTLTTIINETKNTRSWLENITVDRKLNLGLNIGGAYSLFQQTGITLPKFEMPDQSSNVTTGLLATSYKVSQLQLMPFDMPHETEAAAVAEAISTNYKRTQVKLPLFTKPAALDGRAAYGGVFGVYRKTEIKSKG